VKGTKQDNVLTVTAADRLARGTAELLAIEADLTRRGIGVVELSATNTPVSLNSSNLDMQSPIGRTLVCGRWSRLLVLRHEHDLLRQH
jgi:hypothetical protein